MVYQPPSLYGGEDEDVSMNLPVFNSQHCCCSESFTVKFDCVDFADVYLICLLSGGFQTEVIIRGIVCSLKSLQENASAFNLRSACLFYLKVLVMSNR